MFYALIMIALLIGVILPAVAYILLHRWEKANGKSPVKTTIKRLLALELCIVTLVGLGVMLINGYVKRTGAKYIITPEKAVQLEDVDCILVLGCLVYGNGRPSDMLADRLKVGIELYKQGAAPKMLMSGDHGRVEYNEVQVMKNRAIDAGIPSDDIFMDHAGFSTYESLYRAKEVFCAKKIIIVTQEYHLYRALYIAKKLGLEAYGVCSDLNSYIGQANYDAREVLARCKDFLTGLFKPMPKYLGETIPVSGSGSLTDD